MSKKKTVSRILEFEDDDLQALCEAVNATTIDGGGLGWIRPQGAQVLERYFQGLLLVPERMLFGVRHEEVIVGSAQLVREPRNNEAQAMCVALKSLFVAPYARRQGLGLQLLSAVEQAARSMGYRVINADVPETQRAAIQLFIRAGFEHWGTHPHYAQVDECPVRGLFFSKRLDLTSLPLQQQK